MLCREGNQVPLLDQPELGVNPMPAYEGKITIREVTTTWCFLASDIEDAKVRLQDKVDDLIDDVVTASVTKVER